MVHGNNILKTAFVARHSGPEAKDIDLRDETLQVRSALKGNPTPIFVFGTQISTISLPLLKVTSVLADTIVQNGRINHAPTVPPHCVNLLVSYLKDLTKATKPFKLYLRGQNETTETALGVYHAAKVLGMDMYVSHIVPKLDAIFRGLPSYHQLDAVALYRGTESRFYKMTVQNLSRRVREGDIPDPKDFAFYLTTHTGYAEDIAEANKKHEAWIVANKQQEKRAEAVKEAERKKAELVKRKKARQVDEKKFWEAKKANDVKLRKSVEAKLRASGAARKLTTDERAWYIKMYGKQPPKGC